MAEVVVVPADVGAVLAVDPVSPPPKPINELSNVKTKQNRMIYIKTFIIASNDSTYYLQRIGPML